MEEKEILDRVDLSFANAVTSEASLHPFCCHLLKSARQGHVCCRISSEGLDPDPEEVWYSREEKEEGRPSSEEWQHLRSAILEGAGQLPDALLTDPGAPFFRLAERYYLRKSYDYETLCLTHLRRLLSSPPALAIDSARIETHLSALLAQKRLTEEQAHAVRQGCLRSLLFLTGGPGTGKTYTAGFLLSLLWDCISEEQRQTAALAIAAPTGKAAAQLEKSFRKAAGDRFPHLHAQTLHRLLRIGPFSSWDDTSETLPADLILIDESSMIDLPLMARLLSSVKSGARLIFLGDPHQLPPVEIGQCFRDIVEALRSVADTALCHLHTCLRAESRSLLSFAEQIQQGTPLLETNAEVSFHFLPEEEPVSALQQKWKERLLPASLLNLGEDPKKWIQGMEKFRILSPLRKGPWGVETWNRFFVEEAGRQRKRSDPLCVPILLTRSDESLHLFNGELGILGRDEQAFFWPRDQKQGYRSLPAILLPSYELAYCLSVHKSQGSEFDHVFLFLPPGSERFGKEMIYTAATRAKKRLEILTTQEVLEKTLRHGSLRMSGFQHRMQEGRR